MTISASKATVNSRRGLNRLFFVLFAAWTICCTVAYPIWVQWQGQVEDWQQHDKDFKACGALVVEKMSSGKPIEETNECYVRADENWKTATEFHSLKYFYGWDVIFWQSGMLLPILVLPPLTIRVIAGASVWIWRGFQKRLSLWK